MPPPPQHPKLPNLHPPTHPDLPHLDPPPQPTLLPPPPPPPGGRVWRRKIRVHFKIDFSTHGLAHTRTE